MVANKILLENYNALAKIPFVKRAIKRVNVLDKENKDLVSENKTLKKVIEMLTNKHPHCCCSHTKDVPFKTNEKVYIKQEKMTIDELSTSTNNNDINITYEIVSDNGAQQGSQLVYGDDGETTWRTDISQKLPILPNIENTIELTDDQTNDTTSIVSHESEEEEEVEESEESEEEEVEESEEEEVEVEVEESEEEEVEVDVEESEEEEVEVDVEESEEEEVEVEVEVEESEEEEEVEIEVEESEEEEEEEVEVDVEESEEEEEEAYEVTIKKKLYYTTNEIDGIIYSIDKDDEIGDEVGHFKNGKPVFNKKK